MKEPDVLTRMRLCECWGDSLNVEELKEVNDYIEELQQENQELKEQQEEFRKWLENLVANELNSLVIHEHKPYFEEYQDFLEKYEEITGGKNE